MMSTFPECFCFLIYQTPPEYEKGITPCTYRQRSSNIYLVNVLLNNRSSLIILGSLHVILYLPFQPACQPHYRQIARTHAKYYLGSSCSCTALGIRISICIHRNTQAVKYSNVEMGVLSVV